jgi:hypothetical protein
MVDIPKPYDPYEIVLSDLRAKRAQIDQAIATLEGLRAAGLPVSPALVEGQDQGQNNSGEIMQGTFLGMSLADAARKLLTIRKRPLTTTEILEGLQFGGVVFRGQAPGNVVGSILHRHSGTDIVSIARGTWGLKEWYPGRSFKKGAKADNGEKGEDEATIETSETAQPLKPTLVAPKQKAS